MRSSQPENLRKKNGLLVHVVLPVYNEENELVRNVTALHRFLSARPDHTYQIVIADNGSNDRTAELAFGLRKHLGIQVARFSEKGRGMALRRVWMQSDADILSYMDLDLSTDLSCFPPLIDAIAGGGYDIAVGSRRLPGSSVVRTRKREIISRGYNFIVRALFRTRFTDAQCGFKAIRRDASLKLLPLVKNDNWFFDTELLILAEKLGFQINDSPVIWKDDPDSRVRIAVTILENIRELIRLRRTLNRVIGSYSSVRASNALFAKCANARTC